MSSRALLSNKYQDKVITARTNSKYTSVSNPSTSLLSNAYYNKLKVNKLFITNNQLPASRIAFFFTYYLNDVNVDINNNLIDIQINSFNDVILSEFSDRPLRLSYKSSDPNVVRVATGILFDSNLSVLFRIKDLNKIQFIIVINGLNYIVKFINYDKINYKFSFEILEIDKQNMIASLNNTQIQILTTSIKIDLEESEISAFFKDVITNNNFGLTQEEINYLIQKEQEAKQIASQIT